MPLRSDLPCAVSVGAAFRRESLLLHWHPTPSFFQHLVRWCASEVLSATLNPRPFPALARTRPIGSFLYRTLIGIGRGFSVDNWGAGRGFSVDHGLSRPLIQRRKAADSALPSTQPSGRPRIQRGQAGISGKSASVPRKAADSAHTPDGARLGLPHRRVSEGTHG
jgi:hypothetical protein